ncbi:3TM-type holin [Paraburkholderia sp. BL25I1N1]|uniref:3TM-type holin n=1 Tax=Paraburkholderia sp. BL25I1N1 TaxID=1938804 RepID=UPI000D084A8E|nr:3TM-type holin [Paraburkholderia sp. BL25I1N1]PRY07077.1 holin (3TMs family) [Paraburkholderia sp. BL25I1N1]
MAALDPITAVTNVVGDVIDRIWPDPAQAAAAKLQLLQLQQTGELAQITGQMQINQAEAQSADPLQHWRGGMGWVCVAGYAWNFVLQPLTNAVGQMAGHPLNLPPMDLSELSTLTLGMLGLGGLHVAERIKGAA